MAEKKQEKMCEFCGKKFISYSAQQRFCSTSCSAKAYHIRKKGEIFKQTFNKEKNTCRYCGKQFESSNPVVYCSDACRKAARSKQRANSKASMKELARINELARKEGLTYGQYLARHGYGGV